MPHTLHDAPPPTPPPGVATQTAPLVVVAVTPTVPAPADMTTVSIPMPTTVAELRQSDVGDLVAVPRASATGTIDVAPGTPVALVAQDFWKNKTVRTALSIIAGAFSFFMGYVADQVIAGQFFKGNIPWYFDVLIILGVGAGGICLAVFWRTPVLAKVRKAIVAGLSAFFGYVGFQIITNNGLDGIDWSKTMHTGINFAVVAIVGGVLILSKLFDNNPITHAPWSAKP